MLAQEHGFLLWLDDPITLAYPLRPGYQRLTDPSFYSYHTLKYDDQCNVTAVVQSPALMCVHDCFTLDATIKVCIVKIVICY